MVTTNLLIKRVLTDFMKAKITLKEFVDENNTLLTATGVFSALVAVFSSYDIYTGYILLSFSIVLMFYLFCTEILDNLPEWGESSRKLNIFRISLVVFLLNIWVIIIFNVMDVLIIYPKWILSVIYLVIFVKLLESNKFSTHILKEINEQHELIQILLICLLLISTLGAVLFLAAYTEKYVLYILNYEII